MPVPTIPLAAAIDELKTGDLLFYYDARTDGVGSAGDMAKPAAVVPSPRLAPASDDAGGWLPALCSCTASVRAAAWRDAFRPRTWNRVVILVLDKNMPPLAFEFSMAHLDMPVATKTGFRLVPLITLLEHAGTPSWSAMCVRKLVIRDSNRSNVTRSTLLDQLYACVRELQDTEHMLSLPEVVLMQSANVELRQHALSMGWDDISSDKNVVYRRRLTLAAANSAFLVLFMYRRLGLVASILVEAAATLRVSDLLVDTGKLDELAVPGIVFSDEIYVRLR